MAEPMVCMKCGGNTNSHIFPCQCKPAADPAQSAPSAEQAMKIAKQNVEASNKEERKGETLSPHLWNVPLKSKGMDQHETFNWLLEQKAELEGKLEAAALRTAQLERERDLALASLDVQTDDDPKVMRNWSARRRCNWYRLRAQKLRRTLQGLVPLINTLKDEFNCASGEALLVTAKETLDGLHSRAKAAETRAETAESALRQLVRQIYPATSHIEYDGIKTRAECVAEYESFIDEKFRALLTVAAQTPEEK